VRIDRFLFFIRLVKSRTLAQAVIDTGHVRIDGKRAHAREAGACYEELAIDEVKPAT
jgi:ribosomal 50S subunit-recycling heat shock protein